MGNNQSCKFCKALPLVNTDIQMCAGAAAVGTEVRCRSEIPAIAALRPNEFVLDWLPWHCCEAECVRVIALTMEPSNPGSRREKEPVPAAFTPLKYSLRNMLLARPGDGFLITPIAKCSLNVRTANDRKLREQRWRFCSPFLLQEIGAIREAGLLYPDFFVVTVGDHPDGFLNGAPSMKEFLPRRLGKLTHYGAYRYGAFKIADTEGKAYAAFRQRHEPEYRAFVRDHVCWDIPNLDRNLEHDMKILFKWNRQMDPWRARLS